MSQLVACLNIALVNFIINYMRKHEVQGWYGWQLLVLIIILFSMVSGSKPHVVLIFFHFFNNYFIFQSFYIFFLYLCIAFSFVICFFLIYLFLFMI